MVAATEILFDPALPIYLYAVKWKTKNKNTLSCFDPLYFGVLSKYHNSLAKELAIIFFYERPGSKYVQLLRLYSLCVTTLFSVKGDRQKINGWA